MKLPHWLAHKWEKWEPFEVEVGRVLEDGKVLKAIEKRQRRVCAICGWRQEVVIHKGFDYGI